MTDASPSGAGDPLPGTPENPPEGPPEKMGLAFYASLALIGCLVLMVVVLNYPAARANAGIALTQTNWTLQSYTDATGIHIPVMTGGEVTAQFSPDGRVTGSAGCNRFASAYATKDYSINLSGESVTRMYCQEPGIMAQESAFLFDLSKASSFRVGESSLKLFDASGKTILVFVPA